VLWGRGRGRWAPGVKNQAVSAKLTRGRIRRYPVEIEPNRPLQVRWCAYFGNHNPMRWMVGGQKQGHQGRRWSPACCPSKSSRPARQRGLCSARRIPRGISPGNWGGGFTATLRAESPKGGCSSVFVHTLTAVVWRSG